VSPIGITAGAANCPEPSAWLPGSSVAPGPDIMSNTINTSGWRWWWYGYSSAQLINVARKATLVVFGC